MKTQTSTSEVKVTTSEEMSSEKMNPWYKKVIEAQDKVGGAKVFAKATGVSESFLWRMKQRTTKRADLMPLYYLLTAIGEIGEGHMKEQDVRKLIEKDPLFSMLVQAYKAGNNGIKRKVLEEMLKELGADEEPTGDTKAVRGKVVNGD